MVRSVAKKFENGSVIISYRAYVQKRLCIFIYALLITFVGIFIL